MKKIEYYQFMQWDGGDRHHAKEPAFFDKKDADAFLGDNVYDHFDKKTVYIYESVDEYNSIHNTQLKESALAKLTDLEKKALGIL